MIEHEPLDPTMLAVMEIYRRQVTDLKENLQHSEEARESAESNYERERKRADELRGWLRESKAREESARSTIAKQEAKITKLEGVIETLKIELQNAREETTAARENANG